MSAKIETLVICDGSRCGRVFGEGDGRHDTAARQRIDAAADGWRYSGRRDYCPKCWAERRAAKAKL